MQRRSRWVQISLARRAHFSVANTPLSLSRFNRRIHRLADWLALLLDLLGAVFATGEAFVLDSFPLPVCQRMRANRCRKVRGRDSCDWCAAKQQRFFGWWLHLVVTPQGIPVAFDLLPAHLHDLTPVHESTVGMPERAWVYGDKAYNSAADERTLLAQAGVRLAPMRRANMVPVNPKPVLDRPAPGSMRTQIGART